jgi:anti-sigma B factor antagonist
VKKENFVSAPDRPADPTRPGQGKGLLVKLAAGQAGVLVLHCQGRLIDHPQTSKLSELVSEILPSAGRMVVDLSGVKDLDSSGLGELVMAHMWAQAAGFELKFAGPSKAVRSLLELTELVSIFDVYASVPEAVASMGGRELFSA